MRLLPLLLLLSACVGPEAGLRKQVAFDQKCPVEDVKVVAFGPSFQSANVIACGNPLRYKDLSPVGVDARPANWVEVK